MIIILAIQNVRINNLEKEIEIKNKQFEKLSKEVVEYEKRCERIINQNFQLMSSCGWENFSED